MAVTSMNLSWQAFLRHCARHAKHGVVTELECGVVVAWTRSTFGFTNGFFLTTPVKDEQDLRQRLDEIKTYVQKTQPNLSWCLYIEPEWLSADTRQRSKEICAAADFVSVAGFVCMQTTDLLPAARSLPVVDKKFATCERDIHDAALLNVQAHNIEESVAQDIVDNHVLWTSFDKELCCIVSVGGTPVATATALLLDQCVYVALVATSAQHRRVRIFFCTTEAVKLKRFGRALHVQ